VTISEVVQRIGTKHALFPDMHLEPWTAPVLADAAQAAALTAAWAQHRFTKEELAEDVYVGADGTPTMRIDSYVEEAILEVARDHHVNILSEEVGFVDVSSARTLIVDPLDGSANAAAGVGISSFSGVLVEDGEPVEALTTWLETGRVLQGRIDQKTSARTSGRRSLTGAALSMLRPKVGPYGDTMETWAELSNRAGRVRILSSTCVESMLVAEGSIDVFADPGSDTHRLVDLYAAMLLLPQAGGTVIDAFDRPIELSTDLTLRWSGIIGATPEIAEEVRDIIHARMVD